MQARTPSSMQIPPKPFIFAGNIPAGGSDTHPWRHAAKSTGRPEEEAKPDDETRSLRASALNSKAAPTGVNHRVKKPITPASKLLISLMYQILSTVDSSGTGVHITSSTRGAPVASITTRSNPIAIPAAGGMIERAARKSSSRG